jgi:hypothetical protein
MVFGRRGVVGEGAGASKSDDGEKEEEEEYEEEVDEDEEERGGCFEGRSSLSDKASLAASRRFPRRSSAEELSEALLPETEEEAQEGEEDPLPPDPELFVSEPSDAPSAQAASTSPPPAPRLGFRSFFSM